MNVRKSTKNIIAFLICLTVVLIGILFVYRITPKTYSLAKRQCERILYHNTEAMENIATDLLNGDISSSGNFKDFFYCFYPEVGYVSFEIDSQGFLGGQYWELIYTKDGSLYGETDTYLYVEADGNNIVKAEKLTGNWWYLWTDYDGTDKSRK